ncbi:hypothetical protein JCM8097_003768 [Rhodosporidiobolus ruineniae]
MSFEFSITPDFHAAPPVVQNQPAEGPPIDPSLVALSLAQADGQALHVGEPLDEDPLWVNPRGEGDGRGHARSAIPSSALVR